MEPDKPFDPIARAFHWSMAGLWLLAWLLGFFAVYIQDLIGADPLLTIAHKSIASAILVLIPARILWRITHKPPPYPDTMGATSKKLASAGHYGLYAVALLVLPISGWLWSSVAGYPTHVLWVFTLPQPLEKAPATLDTWQWIHRVLAWGSGAAVLGHITMALKHHLVDRDQVLRRMIGHVDR